MPTADSSSLWREPASLAQATEHGLEEAEYLCLVDFFGRAPSMLELGVASAMFSEHCSYKTTKRHLKGFPTVAPWVLQGPGENAGVIDAGEGLALVFKIESHNHPSFIEPFHGAATGVGGILRDVFTMGARPIALMNALRFGDPTLPKTRYLLQRAVEGIGFYGNCMGIPTVRGQLSFDSSFNGNCLVNAFALGVARHDGIFYGRASGVGNRVLYIGSKTGRDGIHGASMASESFEDDSAAKLPSVQVGDPFYEKLLLEACLEIFARELAVGVQDMGAAGMTSSSFEMASRSETGMRIALDCIPLREEGMTPYDIMLSESQERMLFVVEPHHVAAILDICSRWQLDAVDVGEVIAEPVVELLWHGEQAARIPVAIVDLPGELDRPFEIARAALPNHSDWAFLRSRNLSQDWIALVGHPEHASRQPLYEQYDSTVRSDTFLHPGNDAGVVRLRHSEREPIERSVVVSVDCNSAYCFVDAYEGSRHAVFEGARNIRAAGGKPLAISDCLNFGSPKVPRQMGVLVESIRGLKDACSELGLPVVSGNVSLYNQTHETPIRPTPMVATVGLIEESAVAVPSSFQAVGDQILLIGSAPTPEQLAGSDFYEFILKRDRCTVPPLHSSLEFLCFEFLAQHRAFIKSCHDVSSGGLAVALIEALCPPYRSGFGCELIAEEHTQHIVQTQEALYTFLFAESYPRYLISTSAAEAERLKAALQSAQIPLLASGSVNKSGLRVFGTEYPLQQLRNAYQIGLKEIFHQ